jgi:hypothetical protein
MKCPHCDYIDSEYDFDNRKRVYGGKGDFYKISNEIRFVRKNDSNKEKEAYGCPNCNKVFIG